MGNKKVDTITKKIKLLSLKLVVNQEPEEEVLNEVINQLYSSLDIMDANRTRLENIDEKVVKANGQISGSVPILRRLRSRSSLLNHLIFSNYNKQPLNDPPSTRRQNPLIA
jgi:hypothetical protein